MNAKQRKKHKKNREKLEAIQNSFMTDVYDNIRKFNDPLLSMPCKGILPEQPFLKNIASEMINTLEALEHGVGLAAPQLGYMYRVICTNIGKGRPKIMVSPFYEVIGKSKSTQKEGCLSYPAVYVEVERHDDIRVYYRTIKGESMSKEVSGFEARVIQHEVDHLDGICLVGDKWRETSKSQELVAQ